MNTPDHRTVPGYPGLYVLGCWERNVSIYLQQVRALNLAWAFDLPPDAQVAVLGGGFAGLTAAAGLAKRGYRTHLFEKGPCLLQGQRQNRTRWVHPHLHEWPRPGSDNPLAGLPLLDWTAGLAADMAAHILQQFERCGVVTTCDAKATRLEPQGARWRVGDHGEFDAVVLALGLGVEKSFADLPLNAYWMDDTIATEGPFRRFFVSGIGEGGVIDTLYLRLRHFNHADIVRSCLAGFQPLKDRLVALE
ncbi:MAG TPA: FAD-dependent oxidoreductase, partial [Candidatus Xenobia bacterium]